jgi:hypothetical protein
MADGDQNVVYVLNAENRFALFPGIGLTSSGGAYDGSVERYFDVDTSLFLSLSGEQIIDGQKTFALNPIIGTAEPVLTTGDQTVAGIKTFTDRPFVNGIGVVLSGDAAGIATPNDLTFGFGIESSGDFFNGSAAKTIAINSNEIVSITGVEEISGQKTFTLTPKVGSGTVILNTGEQTLSGKLIINNEFIQSGSLNIGGTGSGNFFGTSAILNSFGVSGNTNSFGGFSTLNSFGANTPTNEFGKLSVNKFGEGGINTFYSGIFTGQTIFENNIIVGGGKPVMNTGVEIIGGLKTFSNDLVVEGDLILGHGNTIIYSDVDTIIGGSGNSLSGDASVILGGVNNRLSGDGSFIGVGTQNKVSGVYSFLGGGSLNELFGDHNFIGAGVENKITGSSAASTIVNGANNIIGNSSGCAILGGIGNYVKSDYPFDYSFSSGIGSLWNNIGGGYDNGIILTTGADFSAVNSINGGALHRIHNSAICAIAGGLSNIISGYSQSCFIGAGEKNEIISTDYSSVGGGTNNFISGGGGNSIFGGVRNRIESNNDIITFNSFCGAGRDNKLYGMFSVIVGGDSNICSGNAGFVGGGARNEVKSINSVIVGGENNKTFNTYAAILGGRFNVASGQYSTVLAGDGNQALAGYSTVIGRRAITRTGDLGATVISDGQERDHYSRGAHTLSLDFFNGVYLRLPQFTGLSSQTGNRGEMAVSGDFLYVCTGSVSGWGRIQLSSF